MGRRTAAAVIALIVLAVLGMVACGDGDDGTVPAANSSATTLQDRDRDRDRDRIHQAVAELLDACRDRDRDRLRDHTAAQLRDRLRDGTCDAIAGAEVTVAGEDIAVDGDSATVTLRLTVRDRDGATYELGDTWRFRWGDGGWFLSELPATIDSDAGTPSTLRERARDGDS